MALEETTAALAPLPADAVEVCDPYSLVGPYWKKYSVACELAPTGAASVAVCSAMLEAVGAPTLGATVSVPILPPLANSVNQRLPFGPVAIPSGWLLLVGVAICVITPAVVILPISPGLLNSVK